jgi:hypothetical protein
MLLAISLQAQMDFRMASAMFLLPEASGKLPEKREE